MDVRAELSEIIDFVGVLHSQVEVICTALTFDDGYGDSQEVVNKYHYCVGALERDLGGLYSRMHNFEDTLGKVLS